MAEKHATTWHPGDGPTPRTAADVHTTQQVRNTFAYVGGPPERTEQFDRWLAEHDREVAAQALRDAARYIVTMPGRTDGIADWLHVRADRVAAGEVP